MLEHTFLRGTWSCPDVPILAFLLPAVFKLPDDDPRMPYVVTEPVPPILFALFHGG